ncbi:MAG: hypothetical protein ACD_19C00138G0003 [uncultured bacterium]|nr:MAG: hypothetical protein ACD_19C00138G0003 [uncultured bacterium]
MITENSNITQKYKYVEFVSGNSEMTNPYIVPNVAAIARQMTSGSQIMLIVKRTLSLSPLNIIRFGINNLPFAMSILKMNFAAGVKVLCELEILKSLEKEKTNHFVFHYQMVDMALAFGNKSVLQNFFYLSKKYGFIPGLISNNPERMLAFLGGFSRLPEGLVVYTPLQLIKDNVRKVMEGSGVHFVGI